MRGAWVAAGLAAVAFGLYVPSFGFELVRLDDHVMVVQDHPRNRDPASLLAVFTSHEFGERKYYRPLHRLLFVLDAQRGGLELAVYHRTNALLHAVGTLLVWAALGALGYSRAIAGSLALVFAVHPLLVSDVAWIPGRDNALVTIFLLAAMLALRRALEAPGARAAAGFTALHALAYAGALLSKEAGLPLPALAVAYIVFVHPAPVPRARWLGLGAAWALVLGVYLLVRAQVLPPGDGLAAFGPDALLRSWPTLFALVGKALVPVRLAAFSSHDGVTVAVGVVAVVAVVAVSAWSTRVRAPRVLFGAAWFGLLLAPTLVQRTGLYAYGEYRAYWLLFGLLVVAAELLRAAGFEARSWASRAALAVVCLVFAAVSLGYQRSFDGELPFWEHQAAHDPESGWAWFHVGRAHFTRDQHEPALAAYQRALDVDFENVDVFVDLAALQLARGATPEALAAAERAVALEPGHPQAQYNRGVALLRSGDAAGAVEAFEAALGSGTSQHFGFSGPEVEARFRARVHEQLGRCHAARGETDAAVAAWERAVALDPGRHATWTRLVIAALDAGDRARARRLATELSRAGGQLPPRVRQRLAAPRPGRADR